MKESTEVLLDELLKDYQTPEQILGENGILKQLTKRLAERALQAEMTHHLSYAEHDYQVFFSVVDSRSHLKLIT